MIPTLLQITEGARAVSDGARGLSENGSTGIAVGALVLAFFVILGGGVLLRSLVTKLIASVPDKERVDDALKAVPQLTVSMAAIERRQETIEASMGKLAEAQTRMSEALALALDRSARVASSPGSTNPGYATASHPGL